MSGAAHRGSPDQEASAQRSVGWQHWVGGPANDQRWGLAGQAMGTSREDARDNVGGVGGVLPSLKSFADQIVQAVSCAPLLDFSRRQAQLLQGSAPEIAPGSAQDSLHNVRIDLQAGGEPATPGAAASPPVKKLASFRDSKTDAKQMPLSVDVAYKALQSKMWSEQRDKKYVEERQEWKRKFKKSREAVDRENGPKTFGKCSSYVVNCVLVSCICTVAFTVHLLFAFIYFPLEPLQ